MKKLLIILLVAAMILPLCHDLIIVPAYGEKAAYQKGDINGDGEIDTNDYIMMRLCILGLITLSGNEKNAADVDRNGIIGVTDYIKIRLHILGAALLTDNQTALGVDALYDGVTDRTKKAVNAMEGASYTYSTPPASSYPDDDRVKLTDGNATTSFNKDDWAGLYQQSNAVITFDLGQVISGLADLQVTSIRQLSYGIGLSSKMDLFVSDDGVSYTYINTAFDSDNASDNEPYIYRLLLPNTLSARYIKLSFAKAETVWFFISEVEFMRYTNVETNYYGVYGSEKITEQSYWQDTETDFNVSRNMIKGLPYRMKPLSSIAAAHQTDYYNTPVTNPSLTDGVRAGSSNYLDAAYFHMTQADGRFILFDLGALSTVTSFSGEFLKQTTTGIAPPAKIAVYVSEDGVVYGKAGETLFSSDAASQKIQISFNFDKKYKARYVVIFLQVYSHSWCSEIEIFGTKKVQNDAVTADEIDYYSDAKKSGGGMGDKDSYLMPEDFGGVNNVMLSYHCLTDANGGHNENGLITVDEYLPYVGYYDKNGSLKDTFMDGFLYLPYTAFNYSDYAKTHAGWKFYIDNQFAANRNAAALDTAVSQVKSALGREDYRVSVFFSILYTFKTLEEKKTNSFGDVDGDGVNEDFSTLAGRKKAIKWIIDEQVSRFLSGNYVNLDLKGFYWFEESAGSDPQDAALIKYASDYLHTKGYVLFWIPWYRAAGYEKWEEYGFDAACMQPNYAFNDLSVSRLYDNAEYAKSLGMCVEFESNGTNYAAVKKIKEYLVAGMETGYMKAVKMYYQGGVPGDIYNAYKSTDPYVRSAYDEIYLYSKGILTKKDCYEATETPEPYLASSEYSAGKFTGKIKADSDLTYKVILAESPKYGTLKLNIDGTFIYIPFAGFGGADSFTVYADYTFKTAGSLKIDININ